MQHISRIITRLWFLVVFSVIVGCSSSGSSSTEQNGGTQNVDVAELDSSNAPLGDTAQNREVVSYSTSFLQLDYPATWTLNTSIEDVEAQFLAPGINESGGKNNCTLVSALEPEKSLAQVIDEAYVYYNEDSSLKTAFIDVNGTDMARIEGTLYLEDTPIYNLLAYQDSYTHSIFCFGLTPEEVDLIFSSVKFF